jgi:hypothetical protein
MFQTFHHYPEWIGFIDHTKVNTKIVTITIIEEAIIVVKGTYSLCSSSYLANTNNYS